MQDSFILTFGEVDPESLPRTFGKPRHYRRNDGKAGYLRVQSTRNGYLVEALPEGKVMLLPLNSGHSL